mmetsp:Transcript_7055/g.17057  ORF Transcript_7055/g.17057 Transcript_7055/m.17057 type:complete len:95 (-) Transcript_7055:198-482(-)
MGDAGADAGGEKITEKPEEESPFKQCCYHVLDFCAMCIRCVVASVRCVRWCCQRSCYPVKEAILACCDSLNRWKSPYKKRTPQKVDVPGFQMHP